MILNTGTYQNFTSCEKYSSFADAVTKGYNASIYSDVYLTGYFYIYWVGIPSFLDEAKKELSDFRHLTRVLYTGVQIPDMTLNSTEVVTGFSGTSKISIPTTLEYGTDLTISYNEISGTPISKYHQLWISAIRDPASGLSDIKDYGLNNYTGSLLYITTKPTHYGTNGSFGKSTSAAPNRQIVETAFLYPHVFPITDRQSLFSGSLESSDKLQVEVSYKCGTPFTGDAVKKLAENYLDKMMISRDADSYNIDAGNGQIKSF